MQKVYLVMYNADSTEGRGPMIPSQCFKHEEDAIKYAEANYNWYKHGAIKQGFAQIKELFVLDSYKETEKIAKIEAIKRVKALVSKEDMELLGIKL